MGLILGIFKGRKGGKWDSLHRKLSEFNMHAVQCSACKIQSDICVRNLLLTKLISREKDGLLKE